MKYAYKDKEKTKKIYIDDAIEQVDYYCLNHNCEGILRACALGSTVVPSYFAAKVSAHSDGCFYGKYYLNIKKYQKDTFSLDNFFQNISSESKASTNNKSSENDKNDVLNQNTIPLPNSLFQVYKYCLNSSLNDILSGKKTIEILADLRSENFYTRVITENKIVEGKLIFIDKKNKTLNIQYPAHLEKIENKKYIYLTVKINYPIANMDLFLLNKIYIIGGYFDNFKVTLSNRRQIRLLD